MLTAYSDATLTVQEGPSTLHLRPATVTTFFVGSTQASYLAVNECPDEYTSK